MSEVTITIRTPSSSPREYVMYTLVGGKDKGGNSVKPFREVMCWVEILDIPWRVLQMKVPGKKKGRLKWGSWNRDGLDMCEGEMLGTSGKGYQARGKEEGQSEGINLEMVWPSSVWIKWVYQEKGCRSGTCEARRKGTGQSEDIELTMVWTRAEDIPGKSSGGGAVRYKMKRKTKEKFYEWWWRRTSELLT